MRSRLLLSILCLFVFYLPLSAQENVDDTPVLAISVLPPLEPPPTEAEFVTAYIEAVQSAVDAGANGSLVTETWSKLEASPGELTLDNLTGLISFLRDNHNQTLMLGIQVINTTVKETPPDLLDVPFNSPDMLRRFMALIDAFKPHIEGQVRYLTIGNEVDAYLSAHPEEWDSYTRFYNAAAAYVRLVLPGVQVGVTVTFGGAQNNPQEVARLNETSDVIIMTYYPLNNDFTVRPPDSPLADFPLMLDIAGDKSLILQEVGYPAGESLGSSEADQATFVEHVFEAWDAAGGQIPFLNYFIMGDFSTQMCDDFLIYYQLPSSQTFYDFLCTLGLHTADGTPRAGWQVFVEAGKRHANQ